MIPAQPTQPAPGQSRRALAAVAISTLAQQSLSGGGEARVLAVFPSAAYLADGDRVVAVTAAAIGVGPLSVVTAGSPPFEAWLTPGDRAFLTPDRIWTPRLEISLAGAVAWDPRPSWARLRPFLRSDPEAKRTLRRLVLHHAPPESLASLLGDEAPALPTGTAVNLVGAARPASQALLESLANSKGPARDLSLLESAAASLAGLGGGFTPAGDDFLMGVMYGARGALPERDADRISSALAHSAAPKTTTVSAAYLRAAAEGAAGEAWHRMLEALADRDGQALESGVASLCRIGHTSGADALAGFVLTLERLAGA